VVALTANGRFDPGNFDLQLSDIVFQLANPEAIKGHGGQAARLRGLLLFVEHGIAPKNER